MKVNDLIFASENQQKAREYKSVLGLPNLTQSKVETDDIVDINLETLVRKKLDQVSRILQDRPFFVDHTGILVDALNEFPGGQTSHLLKLLGPEKFCTLVASTPSRAARAKTVIGYHYQGEVHIFEGSVFGEIVESPRGQGQGFDPIFVQDGFTQTYAELGDAVVYRHSMRREACKKFSKFLSARDPTYAPPPLLPSPVSKGVNMLELGEMKWDFFLSHSSEDKAAVAVPLYKALVEMGYSVWFDEATLKVGDGLRAQIDEGLAESRFGILILSPKFFEKTWPQNELAGLFALETSAGVKVILPVWHEMNSKQVAQLSPMLADRVSVSTSLGIRFVADKLAEAAGPPMRPH